MRFGIAALVLGLASLHAGAETLTTLTLPADRPDRFSVDVVHDGRPERLVLERHALRAANFTVRAMRADGSYERVTPRAPGTYRGYLAGHAGSEVFASLDATGLTARVVTPDGGDWWVRPASPGAHVVFDDRDAPDETFECPLHAESETGFDADFMSPVAAVPLGSGGLGSQQRAQIAFDIDFEYFQLKGSSVGNCIDTVEAIMNEVDFFYARDVTITYEITEIVIRTAPYYRPPTGGGDLLDQFREEWNTNQTHVVRDMAHLMTDKDNIEYGGLAWVGVVCGSYAYGWSLDSANIVGHEVGHNWNAPHCLDPSPCNTMCGACQYVAPITKDVMTAFREGLACIEEDVGPHPTPLPPYAHPDTLWLTRDELTLPASAAVDVLGNDHDGNIDPLSIDAFDAVSEHGGSVTLSSGTGPSARDELVYTPPDELFPGADRFGYTVGDATGLSTVGTVAVEVQGKGLGGYWKLDDAGGDAAKDASNRERNGAVEGGAVWVAGLDGGALQLDGIDDAVTIPALGLQTNATTFAAWIRSDGNQSGFSGILFSRAGSTVAGLNFGTANELRYHWNGGEWDWSSNLVVPDLQWVFVALVVEPQRATIYLYDPAGALQTAVHDVPHAIEAFDGPFTLGHDPGNEARRFRGRLDDARVYDYAMTIDEIVDLYLRGGKSFAPNPADRGSLVEPGELSWSAGLAADSHQLYFGADYASVRDATAGSLEYRGTVTGTSLPIGGPLSDGATYAWRVDEVADGVVIPGDVWLFSLADQSGGWALDETGGPTAVDSTGTHDGTYRGGVSLGQPGATLHTGSSIALDGTDDYVEIPALGLDTDVLTITGWARRTGSQFFFAGLVFSRAGNTIAGLGTLAEGELRYHWNGENWDWNSGLAIPDGVWSFFALVVQPDRATVYLGLDGALQSATHVTHHEREEFDGPLHLGRDATGFRYFKGGLDEVRVYRAALTQRDIQDLYSRQLAGLVGAGIVPDRAEDGNTPLRLERAGSDLRLAWSPSCWGGDTDYNVYEGRLGDFSSHVPATCGTGGDTTVTLTPGDGDRYYLVVPRALGHEGGYGADGDGIPRAPGTSSCLLQQVVVCD